ncbi:LysM peptidoglycan-binding domain-containing protein [Primorskyibacter sp. S87]|uniref:LysM peptidoglycan-binding domain-containing protein n=1 Tax=Primorskyibacter sp. S87 TaxID=3415126 RepID=UPI003C7BFC7A
MAGHSEGGLGTLGWTALVGAGAAVVAGGLYFAGSFEPDTDEQSVSAPAAEQTAEQTSEQATDQATNQTPSQSTDETSSQSTTSAASQDSEPEPVSEKAAASAASDGQAGSGEQSQATSQEPSPAQPADSSAQSAEADETASVENVEPSAQAPEPDAGTVADTAAEDLPATEQADQVVAALDEGESMEPDADPKQDAPSKDPAPQSLMEPSFDLVRVEPDGTAMVAGQGAPGSEVQVLIDGQEIDRLTVDSSGNFAGFLTLAPGDAPRVLTLLGALDGQQARSAEEIILAPVQPQHEPSSQDDAVADAQSQPQPDADEQLQADATGVSGAADAEPAQQVVQSDQAAEQDAAQQDEPDTSQAEPAIAVLKSTEEGVELLQPATPQAPEVVDRLSLDTISYSETGDVQLSGRSGGLSGPGSSVRVYLDNRAVADLDAGETGNWKGQLSGITPGVYTLRLDLLNAGGEVVGRLETPFKREAPEVLNPPANPTRAQVETETPLIRAVTVQKGDTLWAISRDRYGEGLLYVRLFEANKGNIRDPDLIYPGQVFTIPE